ncbi:hypothetical protein ACMATS_06100 [Streptoverticillium reticulum]|uniref:hypothetical protein n=1 Tax=Streptoverticillium reticulum TaxID=1433415 RepID=UPI0039BF6C71
MTAEAAGSTSPARVGPVTSDPKCRDWPIDPECCPDWPGPDAPQADKDRAQKALRIASDRLRRLTAGRYGLCEEIVRPCRDWCRWRWDWRSGRWLNPPGDFDVLRPYLEGGRMFNLCNSGCEEDCSCSEICRVTLPGPVHEVLEVHVDGELLDPCEYMITAPPDNWLIRLGGCWPQCQEMTLPDDRPCTFSVRYLRGRDPGEDYDAVRAVSALACELYKSMCGRKCAIPGRIRTIAREGVTYDMVDSWPRAGTGLDTVDDWLALVNPHQLRAPAAVYTPDCSRPRFYDRGARPPSCSEEDHGH